MRVRAVGADALLLEVDSPATWYAELCRRREAGELTVVDIVPGARTVLLDGVSDPTAVGETLRSWSPDDGPSGTDRATTAAPPAPVNIAVTYDGADLAGVADAWGTDVAGVVDRLTGTAFTVAFCGFAPGFAYLTGLPTELALPRLATPRTRVPAGSVALADTYAGIYPTASPGGWRIVGHTDATLFDVERDPPALLGPGTPVRLVPRDAA